MPDLLSRIRRKVKDKVAGSRRASPSPSGSTSAQRQSPLQPTQLLPSTTPKPASPPQAQPVPKSIRSVQPTQNGSEPTASTVDDLRAWYKKQWEAGYSIGMGRLTDGQRAHMKAYTDGSPDAVMDAAIQARDKAESSRWRCELNGRVIVVADQMERVLRKVDKYAKIVDIVIQHSPEVTALVWGGVRFLLMVGQNPSCVNMLTR